MQKPPIITREQWGADEAFPELYLANSVADLARVYNKITVHHDAGHAPAGMTDDQAKRRMRDHQRQHIAQGWGDLGYHYVIDPAGRIYSGRTIFARGTHTGGANTGNLGVCLMGAFHQQAVPAAQLEALIGLCAWWALQLDIAPDAIGGHRDFLATECPGKALYSRLPAVREQVRTRLKGSK